MTESELVERARALEAKRRGLGQKVSIERVLAEAGYTGVQTWYDVRDGRRPVETIERLEQALDRLIDGHAEVIPVEPVESGRVEIEVSGDFNVRVVVRGPGGSAEEIARGVEMALRQARGL